MDVNVATDLWGGKDNIRVTVARDVTIPELRNIIERLYDDESVRRCPPSINCREVPRFVAAHMQVLVDDAASKFVELVSERQLFPGCQLFVFQPPNPFHSDVRDFIPTARDVGAVRVTAPFSPNRGAALHESPRARHALASPAAPPGAPALPVFGGIPPLEAAQSLFHAMPKDKEGHTVSVAEVRARLITCGVRSDDAIAAFPINGRASVTWGEWLQFCQLNPLAVERLAACYLRLQLTQACSTVPTSDERRRSPPRWESDAGPANRDLSPRRSIMTPQERQKRVAERLSSGLSSLVTNRDRDRDDFSHSVRLLPTSPARRTTTPQRAGSKTPVRRR